MRLNRQRKWALGGSPVLLPDPGLRRPKRVEAALVATGSGTKAQPGSILAVASTTNLRRAEQAERQHLELLNPLAHAMTAVELP